MSSAPFWSEVYKSWSAQAEQDKASFMEFLYDLYEPADHTYTGLWERYKTDIAEVFRDRWAQALRDGEPSPIGLTTDD